MFDNAFQRQLKDLARRSDLKIAELKSEAAKMLFTVSGHTQPLYIIDYSGVWEFSCPSIIVMDDVTDIPHPVLAFVLEQNAKNKRGFWCIETIGGKKVISYMHNVPANLLTPDEFYEICWGIVKEVEALEEAFRELIRRLL